MSQFSVVSFHRFRKDGTPNPDIKRAFLLRVTVSVEDAICEKIILEDKSEWKLVLEPPVKKTLQATNKADCIISFQLRVDGCFAVARLFEEDKANAKQRNTVPSAKRS